LNPILILIGPTYNPFITWSSNPTAKSFLQKPFNCIKIDKNHATQTSLWSASDQYALGRTDLSTTVMLKEQLDISVSVARVN